LTGGITYSVFLGFIGLVIVHNYSATKMALTMLATFVAILVILFLITLLFSMWQQLIGFGMGIYQELAFRIGGTQ
jgi:hypothetical protein